MSSCGHPVSDCGGLAIMIKVRSSALGVHWRTGLGIYDDEGAQVATGTCPTNAAPFGLYVAEIDLDRRRARVFNRSVQGHVEAHQLGVRASRSQCLSGRSRRSDHSNAIIGARVVMHPYQLSGSDRGSPRSGGKGLHTLRPRPGISLRAARRRHGGHDRSRLDVEPVPTQTNTPITFLCGDSHEPKLSTPLINAVL